jgi:hypothetical protein
MISRNSQEYLIALFKELIQNPKSQNGLNSKSTMIPQMRSAVYFGLSNSAAILRKPSAYVSVGSQK